MDKLNKDFRTVSSKFMVIRDGETWEGIYNGFDITRSTFDPSKFTCTYTLDDKLWNSMSAKLNDQVKVLPKGTKIRISRKGQAAKTRYVVKVIE